VNGWRLVYPGRPDPVSASGYAAPSWHTFDKRVWRRYLGGVKFYELTLRRQRWNAHKKIATYYVELRNEKGRVISNRFGHDWQALVREMKGKK